MTELASLNDSFSVVIPSFRGIECPRARVCMCLCVRASQEFLNNVTAKLERLSLRVIRACVFEKTVVPRARAVVTMLFVVMALVTENEDATWRNGCCSWCCVYTGIGGDCKWIVSW